MQAEKSHLGAHRVPGLTGPFGLVCPLVCKHRGLMAHGAVDSACLPTDGNIGSTPCALHVEEIEEQLLTTNHESMSASTSIRFALSARVVNR